MFQRIGFKLIAGVGLAVIVIVSTFAYFNIKEQEKLLISEIERHVNQESELIKSSAKDAMLANNRESIYNMVQTIGHQPCIRTVRIMNESGEIVYSSDTTEIGTQLDKKAQACYTCHATGVPLQKLPIAKRTRIFRLHPDSSRTFGVINPIYNEPSCWNSDCHIHPQEQKVLGVLDLTVCLKPVDMKVAEVEMQLTLFALISIISLSLVLWLMVRSVVDKRIKKLVVATREVAGGNLGYNIQDMGNDELGMLARSFNKMTQKLSEARQQLFQSDKMASLGRLAAGVAHEINNPMTGILTYASFLQKRTKDQPEFQEDLAVIVRETKRSREIVKSLLDFARQSVPKKVQANIRQIIDMALKVTESQLALKKIKIEKDLAPDLPKLTVDINQMQQVFTNLIVNASHAIGDEGGVITIQTKLISLRPFGVAKINQALCPKGHNLMDHETKIDGLPSIQMAVKIGQETGFVNLDAIYGRNHNLYSFDVPDNMHLELACPKCSISLIDKKKTCPKCGAPVYFFEVPGKGRFEGCSARNCNWQFWETIEGEGAKDYVQIKVSDTGCGIPKENFRKIFEPFYTTKGQKGTGLGLAVIWGIIDNHNGTISVSSTVGEGTAFTIRIPVDAR